MILQGLGVKHLAMHCTTSAFRCLVLSARLPLFAWSPPQQGWGRDPPELHPELLPPKDVVFFCQISSPKWFTDWLCEQLCRLKREGDTGSVMVPAELCFTYFLNQQVMVSFQAAACPLFLLTTLLVFPFL